MKAQAAYLRFHFRVGARLALRILAPALAATLFVFYILRPEFMLALARALFLDGSLVESGLFGMILVSGLARAVAPRVTAGRAGWARSLPMNGRILRSLEVLSTVVAEAPLLTVLAALAWAVGAPSPQRIALHLAGLLIGASAASLLCIQDLPYLKEGFPALAACFLSFSGNLGLVVAAAALLAFALAVPGKTTDARRRRRPLGNLPRARFFYGLSLRAIGARIIVAYLPSVIVLAACWLMLENNELAADTAFSLSLAGLALSLAVFIALAAGSLAARRPAWPWLRSLPRSAAARIGSDALFLGLNALPVISGLALLGRPAWEAVYLAGPLAWFACRGAGVMREAGDRPFGVLGRLSVEAAIISLSLAVLPRVSWLLVVTSAVPFLLARNAERRLKPTLWAGRHHLNAGDPQSWSAS